jgi:hypothetical protein
MRRTCDSPSLFLQVIKHLAKLDGVPIWGGLLSVTNEMEEIILMLFVPSKAQEHWKAALVAVRESLERYGHSLPELIYTDNVAQDKAFLESIFSSLKDGVVPVVLDKKEAHAYMELPDDVTVRIVRTKEDINTALVPVLGAAEAAKMDRRKIIAGVDAEWRVWLQSYLGAADGASEVALIQIAFDKVVLLIQVRFNRLQIYVLCLVVQ